jgi:hypothetical protein
VGRKSTGEPGRAVICSFHLIRVHRGATRATHRRSKLLQNMSAAADRPGVQMDRSDVSYSRVRASPPNAVVES